MEIRKSDIDRMSRIYYRSVRLLKEAGNSWTIAECLGVIYRIYEDMLNRGYVTMESFVVFESEAHKISISSLDGNESDFCKGMQEACNKAARNRKLT